MFFIETDKLTISPIPEIHEGVNSDGPGKEKDNEHFLHHLHIHHLRELYYTSRSKNNGQVAPLSLAQYLQHLNNDIQYLNTHIEYYNQTINTGHLIIFRRSKIECLKNIIKLQAEIDDKYPSSIITWLPQYHKAVYQDLFEEIKNQQQYLRIGPYLHGLSATMDISQFISILHPTKITDMLTILSNAEKQIATRLSSLYPHQLDSDASSFRHILNQNQILFLGGHNTHCYLFVDKTTGKRWVLKGENHLDALKYTERKVRRKLAHIENMRHFITPILCERRAQYLMANNEYATGNVTLTTFCSEGNLSKFTQIPRPLDEQIALTLMIGICLGEKIAALEESGFINSDLKMTNILVNISTESPNFSLHVSDCKAFYEIDKKGIVVLAHQNSLIGTKYSSPPEVTCHGAHKNQIYGTSIHGYTFGKNLYECLLAHDEESYMKYKQTQYMCIEFTESHFNSFVFTTTAQGHAIRELIELLVKQNPKERIPLRVAIEELHNIKHGKATYLKQRCLHQLQQLRKYKFTNSTHIEQLTKEKMLHINTAFRMHDINKMNDILLEIHNQLHSLKNNQAIESVKTKLSVCFKNHQELSRVSIDQEDESFLEDTYAQLHAIACGNEMDYQSLIETISQQLIKRIMIKNGRSFRIQLATQNLLNRLLLYGIDQSDSLLYRYIYEAEEHLTAGMANLPKLIEKNKEITALLFEYDHNRDLAKIKEAIVWHRSPPTRDCSFRFFFNYRYSTVYPSEHVATLIESTMKKTPLNQRTNIRAILEDEEPEVKEAFQSVKWYFPKKSSSVYPL